MEQTNKWLSDHTGESKVNLDSSFGHLVLIASGDVSILTADASLLMKNPTDTSTFHLTVGIDEVLTVNLLA